MQFACFEFQTIFKPFAGKQPFHIFIKLTERTHQRNPLKNYRLLSSCDLSINTDFQLKCSIAISASTELDQEPKLNLEIKIRVKSRIKLGIDFQTEFRIEF